MIEVPGLRNQLKLLTFPAIIHIGVLYDRVFRLKNKPEGKAAHFERTILHRHASIALILNPLVRALFDLARHPDPIAAIGCNSDYDGKEQDEWQAQARTLLGCVSCHMF